MTAIRVLSKDQSVRLFKAGRFGNTIKTWESYQALLDSGFRKPITFRTRLKEGGNGPCEYNVPFEDWDWMMENWLNPFPHSPLYNSIPQLTKQDIYFNETMDDENSIFHAEVWDGCYMMFSRSSGRSRHVLTNGSQQHVSWASCPLLLKDVMDSKSWQTYEWLQDEYPHHVIELTVYNRKVGTNRMNTMFWEARLF